MSRPKSDSFTKRDHQIMVRFTQTEYENIAHNAKNAGLSLSAYAHDLVCNGKVSVHYQLSPQIDEIKPLLSAIGKTGSNLNQIARFLNSGGSATDNVITDIQSCISELFDLRKMLSGSWGDFNGNP